MNRIYIHIYAMPNGDAYVRILAGFLWIVCTGSMDGIVHPKAKSRMYMCFCTATVYKR
jgi:hypothetical protein